ncbi:MAG: hypothetical protein RLZZ488_62 [Pseudomonadota bacterium]|jgi:hypothetical protein
MLKTSGIIRLTLRENLRGQLLWVSATAGSVLLILLSVLSGVALSHESRVIDVFSYFAADQLLLLLAVFSGSSICSTDFSSRGLAELYIPAGASRLSLYIARLFAYAVVLLALATVLFGLKIFILPRLSENQESVSFYIQFNMLFFAWLKSLTALSVAGFMGTLVRPIYSTIATITLFSFGHLTASFDTLMSAGTALNQDISAAHNGGILYWLLKIWNPNLLIVNSTRGEWIAPTPADTAQALSWALAFILIPIACAVIRLNRIDVRP